MATARPAQKTSAQQVQGHTQDTSQQSGSTTTMPQQPQQQDSDQQQPMAIFTDFASI